MNPPALAVAESRRARELHMLQTERERVNRVLADTAIGQAGQPRLAAQTSELEKLLAELDSKSARIASLSGDELVSQYVPESA